MTLSKPHAAVAWVRAALDEAGGFHAIDMAADGDRLHVEQGREPRLVDALVHRDPAENLKLRGGHAEMARFLLEAFPEQPGGIHEQEAERTNLCHARAYNKLAYNRQAHQCAGLTHRCEALGSSGHQTSEQENADENRQRHGCPRPKAFRVMPLVELVLFFWTWLPQTIEFI